MISQILKKSRVIAKVLEALCRIEYIIVFYCLQICCGAHMLDKTRRKNEAEAKKGKSNLFAIEITHNGHTTRVV